MCFYETTMLDEALFRRFDDVIEYQLPTPEVVKEILRRRFAMFQAADVDWSPLVAGCDAVVHLAGIVHTGSEISDAHYDRVNHRATIELAEAAGRAGATRFVFASSIRAQSG
jgi:nucleoside-diphosphate-sugar epimerase